MEFFTLPSEMHLLFFVGMMFIFSEAAGNLANSIDLPRMIGYIAAGIVFGPYVLNWYDRPLIEVEMAFFREFALSIIAFSIGGALQMPLVRRLRSSLTWITLLQTSLASLLVFLAMWWLLPFTNGGPEVRWQVIALILAAVSAATAPAAVLSLVDEYQAKGEFKSALLGIVALDDVIAVLFYSIAIAVAASLLGQDNGSVPGAIVESGFHLLTEVTIGLLIGFITARSLAYFSEYRTMLGTLLGLIMAITGFCLSVGMSALLICLTVGFMVTNVARHELADEAMEIINTVQQPVFGVFFFTAGAHLDIGLVFTSGALVLAIVLTLSRFAGKYLGTLAGGWLAGTDPQLTRNLGLSLLPAAGVMVGLTLNAGDSFRQSLGDYTDVMVATVIGATLINEFLTPFFVRHAIRRQR